MIVHVLMYQFRHELNQMANMVKAKKVFEEMPSKMEWVNSMRQAAFIDKNRKVLY